MTTPQQVANNFTVAVNGTALPSDVAPLLDGAYVEDNLHLPDVFVLRFRDPDRLVLGKTSIKIGSQITVSVVTSGSPTPEKLIVGEVTAIQVEADTNGTHTVIRGMDVSHRLFRGRNPVTYKQVTVSDVVRKVASRAGVPLGSVASTSLVYDQLEQVSSDWEFLSSLSGRSGLDLGVVDGKLELHEPTDASSAPGGQAEPGSNPLVLNLGTDLLRFRAVVTGAEQVPHVQVRGWDIKAKKALVAEADAATTSVQLGTSPAQIARTFDSPPYVSGDVPYRTQAEVDRAAKALAEQVACAFAEVDGIARGNPKLRAGTAISIENLGDPFDGKYTLSSTRHHYDPATGYTVWLTVAGRGNRSLFAMASGGSGGVPRNRVPGVAVGIVSDVTDPDKLGRVKVQLPWYSDDFVTDWMRTVQLGAGSARGAMILPEVGDEVLVAFEYGDVHQGYVVGGLYNGVDKPNDGSIDAVDGSGKVQRRSFHSRTNHRLEMLEASSGDNAIKLTTGDDKLAFTLDAQATKITVHSDGSVTIEAKNGVKVDAGTGKLEMTGQQMSLTAQTGITLDGGAGSVAVSSNGPVSVKGATVSVEGQAQTEIKGGAMCAISAALVRIN